MRLIDADALLDEAFKICTDCERRKGVKNGKYRIIYKIGEAPCRACSVDDMKATIEDAPTIEPKKGRCTNESRYFHCSVCDYGVQDVFEGSYEQGTKTTYVFEKGGEWNYCPNCGAKMERSEDGET